jgi:hypothetical protein
MLYKKVRLHIVQSTPGGVEYAWCSRLSSSRDEYCSILRGPPRSLASEEMRSEVQPRWWCQLALRVPLLCRLRRSSRPGACKNPLQGWEKTVPTCLLSRSRGRLVGVEYLLGCRRTAVAWWGGSWFGCHAGTHCQLQHHRLPGLASVSMQDLSWLTEMNRSQVPI